MSAAFSFRATVCSDAPVWNHIDFFENVSVPRTSEVYSHRRPREHIGVVRETDSGGCEVDFPVVLSWLQLHHRPPSTV